MVLKTTSESDGYFMEFSKKAREPISSLTHLIGAGLSVIGSVILLIKCSVTKISLGTTLSCLVFCISLISLYTASGVYHYVQGSDKRVKHYRRIDHSMVYVLIAGTYTPVFYAYLPKPKAYYLIAAIWGIAIIGMILKILFITMPRWLGTCLYIAMGWFVVLVPSIFKSMPTGGLVLLFSGGIIYTIGGLIYWTKKPDFLGKFGFHEVFHIFIMVGSLLHYLMILLYIA